MEDVVRRPLPYPDESRIVALGQLWRRDTTLGAPEPTVNWMLYGGEYQAWLQGTRTLESTAVFGPDYGTIVGPAGAEFLKGGSSSPELLNVLRTQPIIGRWIARGEATERVVVLSHGLWQRQFAGDSNVLGKVLRRAGEPWTVIGVMPPDGGLPIGAEYWVPMPPILAGGELVARPRPGVPLSQVALELKALSPAAGRGLVTEVVVMPLRERLFGSARGPVRLLMGAAAMLLLIACANIANLSLVRTLERQRELAVRMTLGGSKRSLAVLVLTENFLLAVFGAIVGLVLAVWATRVVVAIGPDEFTRGRSITIGLSSVLFGGGLAILAALVVSVAPVLTATDRGMQPLLSGAVTRTSRSHTTRRVRYALVATQLAVALLLVTGAGLLIRRVQRLTRPDRLGFSPDGVVIASVPLSGADYRVPGKRDRFIRELDQRVRSLPGVQHVGFGPPPLVGGRGEGLSEGYNMIMMHFDTVDGRRRRTTVFVKHIDPGYLDAYGIRLRSGRALDAQDDQAAPRVALLSATAARLYFPDRDPVGQTLDFPLFRRIPVPPVRVVGVVDDVLQRDLTMEANPEIFFPIAQHALDNRPTVAVRTSGPTAPLIAALRRVLRDIDPEAAASRLEPMQDVIDASLSRHAFLLLLLGIFAGLGLVLSAIGLYAVISYLVMQRTLEIGIRMALGAQRSDVLGLVLREGVLLTATGLLIGISAALALTRFLSSFLFEVQPRDITTFAAAPIALSIIAMIAAVVPARRAAAVDPAIAMRADG
jgi:putative ABC transport system permease protein